MTGRVTTSRVRLLVALAGLVASSACAPVYWMGAKVLYNAAPSPPTVQLDVPYDPAAPDDPKRQLDLCIKVAPKNPDCHKLLGSIWGRLEQPDKGLREYKEFIRLAPPDHPDLDRVKQIISQFENAPAK